MDDKFEEKAKAWDDNPIRVEMANAFSEEVKKNVKIGKDSRLMEFGCGTGLVGMALAPLADSILMIDTSRAMLSVLRDKVSGSNLRNIEILEGNIERLKIKKSSIDLIVSFMTLHHVKDIPGVLGAFRGLLKGRGSVIIGDLCREDGGFHGAERVEHHGFDMDEIKKVFDMNDLPVGNIYKFNTLKKPDGEGKIRGYDQFILIAHKG